MPTPEPDDDEDTRQPKKISKPSPSGQTTLPSDLVAEVLQRLPSKSLGRFRCVCWSWNRLISSDGFVDRYLQEGVGRQRHGPTKLVLAPLAKRHANKLRHALCRDCPRIIGARPCRGLVLLCRPCVSTYSVCNPSTRGLLHLPPCHRAWYMSSTGIGFHAPSGEYKVVHLAELRCRRASGTDCRVLTVGDPQGWREPSGEPCSIIQDSSCVADVDPVFANGRLHWTLSAKFLRGDNPQGILAFALGDESFATVPLPPFAAADVVVSGSTTTEPHLGHVRPSMLPAQMKEVHTPAGTVLAELDGHLCMMRDIRLRADLDGMFEIWKLEDYESGAWTLDCRINVAAGHMADQRLLKPWLVMPLAYLGGGMDKIRKVLLATTAHEAHVYEPETNTLRTVASMTDDDRSNCETPFYMDNRLRLVLYQESPVRIAGMEHDAATIGYSIILSEQV